MAGNPTPQIYLISLSLEYEGDVPGLNQWKPAILDEFSDLLSRRGAVLQ